VAPRGLRALSEPAGHVEPLVVLLSRRRFFECDRDDDRTGRPHYGREGTAGSGFGDNTLVFLPSGFPYAQPAADTAYTITVGNVGGAGVPACRRASSTPST
jgi:hypothetical protein